MRECSNWFTSDSIKRWTNQQFQDSLPNLNVRDSVKICFDSWNDSVIGFLRFNIPEGFFGVCFENLEEDRGISQLIRCQHFCFHSNVIFWNNQIDTFSCWVFFGFFSGILKAGGGRRRETKFFQVCSLSSELNGSFECKKKTFFWNSSNQLIPFPKASLSLCALLGWDSSRGFNLETAINCQNWVRQNVQQWPVLMVERR